jgi:endonuclease/exonuclease/phosphatase family metal-dependent hydrolase
MSTPLRIVAYNTFQGGPRDPAAWVPIMRELAPDVLCLQESRDPATWLPALDALPGGSGAILWQAVPRVLSSKTPWGSALWVRGGTLTPLPLPDDFVGWVAAALVTGPAWPGLGIVPLPVFSVHAPTRESRSNYIAEMHRLLDYILAAWPGQPMILAGDFNVVAGRRQSDEPIKIGKKEYSVLDRLGADLGLIACWQAAHPGEPLGRTLRWPRRPDSLPYHCDGIFVPAAWAGTLAGCDILEDTAWQKRSDHNPVVARFESR